MSEVIMTEKEKKEVEEMSDKGFRDYIDKKSSLNLSKYQRKYLKMSEIKEKMHQRADKGKKSLNIKKKFLRSKEIDKLIENGFKILKLKNWFKRGSIKITWETL